MASVGPDLGRIIDQEECLIPKTAVLDINQTLLAKAGIRHSSCAPPLLRPCLRVLDAGCGDDVVSLALHDALTQRRMARGPLHAVDLTPAMLDRFQRTLGRRGIEGVEARRANVLELDGRRSTT